MSARRQSDPPTRAERERIERGREFRIANISRFLRAQHELAGATDDRLREIARGVMGEYSRPWPPTAPVVPYPKEKKT